MFEKQEYTYFHIGNSFDMNLKKRDKEVLYMVLGVLVLGLIAWWMWPGGGGMMNPGNNNNPGTTTNGQSSDVRLREWIEPFREHAFLSVDESFSQGSLRQKISELRSFQQSRASVLDLGMELLEKNLSQTAFDAQTNPRELFELFCEGESEKALQLLRASPPKKG
jgi:hypothetical protein